VTILRARRRGFDSQ